MDHLFSTMCWSAEPSEKKARPHGSRKHNCNCFSPIRIYYSDLFKKMILWLMLCVSTYCPMMFACGYVCICQLHTRIKHTSIHVCVFLQYYVYIYLYIYIFMYIMCIYVNVNVYTYVYIYIYIMYLYLLYVSISLIYYMYLYL